jgi:hypothetical protein
MKIRRLLGFGELRAAGGADEVGHDGRPGFGTRHRTGSKAELVE